MEYIFLVPPVNLIYSIHEREMLENEGAKIVLKLSAQVDKLEAELYEIKDDYLFKKVTHLPIKYDHENLQ